MVAPLLLLLLWTHAPAAGVGVVLLSHALVLYPTLRPNVQWLGPVVTRFQTDLRQVWLTIDDGPSEDTLAVLDLFARHGVKATFFVRGDLAAARGDLVEAILAGGHSVANHSQTHPSGSFWCALPGRIASEIDDCNRVLSQHAGTPPRWFRAPVGMKNPAVHPALRSRGMRLIGWSTRGFDTVVTEPQQVISRILSGLAPGAILLMHQGYDHSLRVLEDTIVAIKERGYELVIPEDGQLRD